MAVSIPLVIAGVSAAAGAYSAISAGEAQSRQQQAAANAADYNAKVSENAAQSSINTANANAVNKTRALAYQMSQQRASIGQSGTAMTGTNLDVIGQSAANAGLDAANIRFGGDQQAYTDRTQTVLDNMSATQARSNADDAIQAGYIGAATSVLGAASNYYSGSTKLKTKGP